MPTELTAYLHDCDARYSADCAMLGLAFTSPGYHTRVATGTWVHPTLTSLEYAVLLLRTSAAAHWRRAANLFRAVLDLQDTDAASPTYGLWPYVLEEPLAAMAVPDRNWADFCGGRLAEALCEHPERLAADLVAHLRAALGHAAWRIFRDNIRPHYTNIAIMGGGVCAAAGELLREPRLLSYARQRLQRVVAHTHEAGAFNEYNSPAYTIIALEECERMLHLVQDAEVRACAETLRQAAWEQIAAHFHPPTQQWAGPHSRTYTDLLSVAGARFLRRRTGVPLALAGRPAEGVWTGPLNLTIKPLPCPPQYVAAFRTLPSDPVEVRRRCIKRPGDLPATTSTTWMTHAGCLGSVSRDNLLYQRRPVVAYWRTAGAAVACLRLRFLHDGRDFSSAYVCNDQRQHRVLSAISLVTNLGDYSLHLDCPPDGVFQAEDFRLRYHLLAPEAQATRLGPLQFELTAAPCRAVVQALPGRFGPYPVQWTCGSDGTSAYVDAICYQGPRRGFKPAELGEVVLACAMELLHGPAPAAAIAPMLEVAGDAPQRSLRLTWAADPALVVTSPLLAGPYLWA